MEDNKPTLQQKGRYGLQYRGVECTNCDHPLDVSDRFCPNCSQANSTKKLTLKDFIEEFFASLISYDSKLLKTFSALLTKPGKITRDYIAGKRVSYTNPFRFLLSLSIIYFLMVNFSNNFSDWDKYGVGKEKSIWDKVGTLNFSTDDFVQIDSIPIKEEEKELIKALDTLNIMSDLAKRDSIMMTNPIEHFSKLNERSLLARFGGKREFFNVLMKKKKIYGFEEIPAELNIDSTRENKAAFNAARSYLRFKQQPGSFFSSVVSRLPFFIFFFLPVFAFFIWLAYIRKKYTYTEHLVFSFHNQSLLFILLIISFLVDSIFNIYTGWLFFLIFAIYLFLAMRKFYQQGFFKTSVKYIFLNTIFFILAMFAMAILFTGSAFTY
ncbi:DUF3667 domain-containing protein [Maribacter sp. 2308TA10-17]|uniref:DUF3667 domain-containing protein n=1 Tax=Maribacter sp. 2308TA10-17 TaxID=3386276 RepID=UPI0039BD31C7